MQLRGAVPIHQHREGEAPSEPRTTILPNSATRLGGSLALPFTNSRPTPVPRPFVWVTPKGRTEPPSALPFCAHIRPGGICYVPYSVGSPRKTHYKVEGHHETVFLSSLVRLAVDSSGKLCLLPLTCITSCLLYTSPSPRDATLSRMPSSA